MKYTVAIAGGMLRPSSHVVDSLADAIDVADDHVSFLADEIMGMGHWYQEIRAAFSEEGGAVGPFPDCSFITLMVEPS